MNMTNNNNKRFTVKGTLPVDPAEFRRAAQSCGVVLLMGSAPVGPTTVARLRDCAGSLPTVRFGSTETCLQVAGTPLAVPVPEAERVAAAGAEGGALRWVLSAFVGGAAD